MKDILIEIKNNLQGNSSRVEEAEIQINDLEYKEAKNNQSEQQEEKMQKKEDSISSLWDNFKTSNIHIIGVAEIEEKEQEIENLFKKIMTENFLNLAKDINIQVQEAASPKQDEHKEAHTKIHHN